jgi:hypothetical protein
MGALDRQEHGPGEKHRVLPRILHCTFQVRIPAGSVETEADEGTRRISRELLFLCRGGDWNSGGSCNGETEPTFKGAIIDSYPQKMRIVEEAMGRMRFPVRLLNVTKLTNFRRDGHPSVYGKARDKKVSKRKQDCSHWCLPGVPDAWNELIYASLVLEHNPIAWKNR